MDRCCYSVLPDAVFVIVVFFACFKISSDPRVVPVHTSFLSDFQKMYYAILIWGQCSLNLFCLTIIDFYLFEIFERIDGMKCKKKRVGLGKDFGLLTRHMYY